MLLFALQLRLCLWPRMYITRMSGSVLVVIYAFLLVSSSSSRPSSVLMVMIIKLLALVAVEVGPSIGLLPLCHCFLRHF
jgi:hypothetical protein